MNAFGWFCVGSGTALLLLMPLWVLWGEDEDFHKPSRAAESPRPVGTAVVDEWERIEGESMRDGHRATLERLIDMGVAALATRAPWHAVEHVLEARVQRYEAALRAISCCAWDCASPGESCQARARRALEGR